MLATQRRARATSDVVTTLELRAGERFLRVHVELDHRVRDHRLRAHFPLPAPVDGSDAECAFAVVHRGLTAEGGPHEFGLPTFVSRRFVDCTRHGDDGPVGLALVHDGLLEYEVVGTDDRPGTELALTLVRATGYLSRSEPVLRPNPAGPLDRARGPTAADAARARLRGARRTAATCTPPTCPRVADDVLVPLERVRGGGWPGATSQPACGRALASPGPRCRRCLRDDDRRARACGW